MSEKLSFEEALSSLENEVKRLESGNMSLEDSLSSFESAIKLIKICNERLESAERKVKLLTEDADGSVIDVPFEGAADAT